MAVAVDLPITDEFTERMLLFRTDRLELSSDDTDESVAPISVNLETQFREWRSRTDSGRVVPSLGLGYVHRYAALEGLDVVRTNARDVRLLLLKSAALHKHLRSTFVYLSITGSLRSTLQSQRTHLSVGFSCSRIEDF